MVYVFTSNSSCGGTGGAIDPRSAAARGHRRPPPILRAGAAYLAAMPMRAASAAASVREHLGRGGGEVGGVGARRAPRAAGDAPDAALAQPGRHRASRGRRAQALE